MECDTLSKGLSCLDASGRPQSLGRKIPFGSLDFVSVAERESSFQPHLHEPEYSPGQHLLWKLCTPVGALTLARARMRLDEYISILGYTSVHIAAQNGVLPLITFNLNVQRETKDGSG